MSVPIKLLIGILNMRYLQGAQATTDELAKAYFSSLSTYHFLQYALEKSPEATGLDQEIVEPIGKVQTAYQTLAELHIKLDELAQEFLHT